MTTSGKLALFDLDNTLIDRQAAFHRWTAHFVEANDLGEAAFDWIVELDRDGFASREEVFVPVRERYGLASELHELVADYRRTYPSFVAREPEVVAAMERLGLAGWRRAIVTNGPPSQHEKIARAGLEGSFDAICVSSEVGVDKPDVRIFEEAASRCGAALSSWAQRWMVGDAPGPDMTGGATAGLRTIWMHRGRTWSDDAFEPDAVAGSIPEAVDVLLASS